MNKWKLILPATAMLVVLLLAVLGRTAAPEPSAPAAVPTPAATETPAPASTQTPSPAPTETPVPSDEPTPTEASVTAGAPALRDVLLRLDAGYDPASGAVMALRWAGRLLEAYGEDGRNPAAAQAEMRALLNSGTDAALWSERLERLEWAALRIASGEVAGLISEHHAPDAEPWTEADVEELFSALNGGL